MGGRGVARVLAAGGDQRGLRQPRSRRRHARRPRRHRLPALRQEERHAAAHRPLAHRRLRVGERRVPRRRARRRDPDAGRAPGAGARSSPAATRSSRCRTRRASATRFAELELLVVLDIFRNETALARALHPAVHLALRARRLCRSSFRSCSGLQSRPYLQATERVVAADGEQRDEATIYLDLCRAAGVSLFGSRVAQRLPRDGDAPARRCVTASGRQRSVPQELLLSLLLRATRQGSFKRLLRPTARRAPSRASRRRLPRPTRVVTDDGKRAPGAARAARVGRDARRRARARASARRPPQAHHQARHPHPQLVDAQRRGVRRRRPRHQLPLRPPRRRRAEPGSRDGDLADVTSETATVRVPVRLLDDLMPGTVALPHGWGHQHATGLSVASRAGGVNVNLLAADGPDQARAPLRHGAPHRHPGRGPPRRRVRSRPTAGRASPEADARVAVGRASPPADARAAD